MQLKKTGSEATLNRSYKGSILWAVTVKYNPNGLSLKELKEKYNQFFSVFPYDIIDKSFETKDKLHLHACFLAPSNLFYKSLSQLNFHVYAKKVYDIKGWRSYKSKENNADYVARQDQKNVEVLAKRASMFHDCYKQCLHGNHSYNSEQRRQFGW